MKHIYFLLFFLLFGSCTFWWTITEAPYIIKKIRWRSKSTPVKEHYFDSINIEVVNGHLIGKITIAGEERLFLFDTGAETIIDEKDVAREGIKTSPKPDYNVRDENDFFYKHIRKRGFFKSDHANLVDTIVIGNTAFKKVGASTLVFDVFNHTSECYNYTGLLGNNVMKDGVWSFDYKNQKIRFSDNINNLNLKGAVEFDFDKFSNELPIIKLPFMDTVLRVGIDTGNASIAISTNDELVFSIAKKIQELFVKNIDNMNISSYLPKKFLKKQVQLVDIETFILDRSYKVITVSNMKIDRSNEHAKLLDLIVGHEFLKNFVTTIDYVNNKLYLQPVELNSPNYFDDFRNINFSLLKYDNKPYISHYLPNLIDSTKVDIGDTVLAVNHVPMDSILKKDNYCEFIRGEQTFYPKPDTNIITIKNKKGEIHDFKSYTVTLFED